MFNKILVPIDFSSEGEPLPILQIARNFAANYSSKLVLLHVLPSIPGYVEAHLPNDLHKKRIAEVKENLQAYARTNELPDETEIAVSIGHPAQAILDCAGNHNIEAILIAAHDPGLADYLLGSTSARVVRHAHCSVFIIRNLTD